MVTGDLLTAARAGDGESFRALVEPHRRELHVHCYRMLGSVQDAEDMVQETLMAAWRGFDGYEGRASVRSWLYRIATNRCLNALRDGTRRPRAGATFGDRAAATDPHGRAELAAAVPRLAARRRAGHGPRAGGAGGAP